MTKDFLSPAYIGTGCNKSAHVMDWGVNNLICFGACNSVALYDPTTGKILSTLVGHKGEVNCVRWIQGTRNELVSGCSSSWVIVWSLENSVRKSSTILEGHGASIVAVDGRNDEDLGVIIISSSADNTICIWWRSITSESFVKNQVINTGSSFALCLSVLKIPQTHAIFLAYGTDIPEVVFNTLELVSGDAVLLNASYVGKSKGHEDWIRCIDMTMLNNGDILIASSSQDMMIRISRLSLSDNDSQDDSFNVKKDEICIGGLVYYLSLESVLYGHEGWVYSVNWSPYEDNGSPHLLSASFDRTLIIWKPCHDTGVWLEDSRMGELGGDSTLGYYGAKFNPDGLSVLANSYQGSFHLWRKIHSKWVAEYVIGGHSDAVTDISWEKNGRFLMSVSTDKTTRLHATCLKGTSFNISPWCELSRPQIHGHSLHSIDTLPSLGFASCSEEKVVRVFLPSVSVLKLLNYFCDSLFEEEMETSSSLLPSSASITALGLSNKGNFENGKRSEQNIPEKTEKAREEVIIPNEDFLVQNTLWPEVMKLYGHGNDAFTIAASNDGTILATASKTTTAEQAKIILWDTQSWNIITKLEGHQLTVTQMKFSFDDGFLLSVSRDRKWCLFKKTENNSYTLYSTSQKGKIMHSRIIWTCAWSHDGLYFATGSRDCKVIIWDLENPVFQYASDHGSVTALDFSPVKLQNSKYIVALGYESGLIQIYSWSNEWQLLHSTPRDIGHHLTVQKLIFRPVQQKSKKIANDKMLKLQLASCSDDHSVRIYDFNLDEIPS